MGNQRWPEGQTRNKDDSLALKVVKLQKTLTTSRGLLGTKQAMPKAQITSLFDDMETVCSMVLEDDQVRHDLLRVLEEVRELKQGMQTLAPVAASPPDEDTYHFDDQPPTSEEGPVEVLIKGVREEVRSCIRTKTKVEALNIINDVLRREEPMLDILLKSFHIKKTGDVCLWVPSETMVEQLRGAKNWLTGAFGPGAYVEVDTYGVVIHAVNLPGDFETTAGQFALAAAILMKNRGSFQDQDDRPEITRFDLLHRKRTTTPIVAYFANAAHANIAIRYGLISDAALHRCERYVAESRITRCHRCQEVGHPSHFCLSSSPRCVDCAGWHTTEQCSLRDRPGFKPTCANCEGEHRADSETCRVIQKDRERANKAKAAASPLWPEIQEADDPVADVPVQYAAVQSESLCEPRSATEKEKKAARRRANKEKKALKRSGEAMVRGRDTALVQTGGYWQDLDGEADEPTTYHQEEVVPTAWSTAQPMRGTPLQALNTPSADSSHRGKKRKADSTTRNKPKKVRKSA